ncbi:MAG: hypothetical protein RLZZ253_1503 [Verrucomicrobiota bacterium]|jgi:hypothetical protein
MNPISRRAMLQKSCFGFGYLALSGLAGSGIAAETGPVDLKPRAPVLPARVRRVIFLCMSGGPAQMDTFNYRPQVLEKPHPGSMVAFDRQGQSGIWMSELLPNLARHADKLCVLNAMQSDTGNHAQSFLQLHTGDRLRPCPSMGAWVGYGLGSENQNLPGFICLNPWMPSVYSAGCLPAIFEGTPIGLNGEDMSEATIRDIENRTLSRKSQQRQFSMIQALNREHQTARPDDERLEGVIQTMELGFRMQSAAPGLLDLRGESKETLARYCVGKNHETGRSKPSDFGRQCLLARRFAEAGVRFIELDHRDWDQHENHRRDLAANCATVDAPIAALLDDLEQGGLLDDTLVVWGGEFGRPGMVPGHKEGTGSGHNNRAFTYWLAGGGVKGGFVHGKTNHTGDMPEEGQVHFRDLHATILHLLGLDHQKLAVRQGGREIRLTGAVGGKIVREILA